MIRSMSLRTQMTRRTLIVGLVADVLATLIFFIDPGTAFRTALLVASPMIPLGFALWVLGRGRAELAGWIGSVTCVAISLTIVSAFWGLNHTAIFLVVGVVASGLFVGPRGSLFATLAALIYVAFEFRYQISPWLIDRPPMLYERAMDISVAVIIIGVMSGLGVQRIHRLLEDRDREQGFRDALLRGNPTPTLIVDGDGRVLEVNDALVQLTGHPMEDLVGSITDDWFTGVDPVELRGIGGTIPVRIRSSEIDLPGDKRAIVALTDLRSEIETLRQQGEAVRAAEEASRAKSAFLAGMSHELRTPLNAIIGYAELLEEDAEEVEVQHDLDRILTSGRHLLSLVDQVLDMSRVEAGKMEVATEVFPLGPMVVDVVMSIRPGLEARGLKIEVAGEVESDVLADRIRTRQVLLNLLSNALKFAAGKIRIEVDGAVRITVSDDGPGVPDSLRPRLFQPFARGAAAQSSTGLGLALSRELAVRMGGGLRLVESGPLGGASFEFTLPQAPS